MVGHEIAYIVSKTNLLKSSRDLSKIFKNFPKVISYKKILVKWNFSWKELFSKKNMFRNRLCTKTLLGSLSFKTNSIPECSKYDSICDYPDHWLSVAEACCKLCDIISLFRTWETAAAERFWWKSRFRQRLFRNLMTQCIWMRLARCVLNSSSFCIWIGQ